MGALAPLIASTQAFAYRLDPDTIGKTVSSAGGEAGGVNLWLLVPSVVVGIAFMAAALFVGMVRHTRHAPTPAFDGRLG